MGVNDGCMKDNSIENINNNFKIIIENALKTINKLRKKHNSCPLNNNKKLNQMAQNYAKELFHSEKLYSNFTYKGEALGENVFLKYENKKPKEICKEWYKENENHNFNSEKLQKDSIHFTQLVWKESKEFGFGYISNGNKTCAVALYYPSGNKFLEFKKNVEAPSQ